MGGKAKTLTGFIFSLILCIFTGREFFVKNE
jgi:hypothetical protein